MNNGSTVDAQEEIEIKSAASRSPSESEVFMTGETRISLESASTPLSSFVVHLPAGQDHIIQRRTAAKKKRLRHLHHHHLPVRRSAACTERMLKWPRGEDLAARGNKPRSLPSLQYCVVCPRPENRVLLLAPDANGKMEYVFPEKKTEWDRGLS